MKKYIYNKICKIIKKSNIRALKKYLSIDESRFEGYLRINMLKNFKYDKLSFFKYLMLFDLSDFCRTDQNPDDLIWLFDLYKTEVFYKNFYNIVCINKRYEENPTFNDIRYESLVFSSLDELNLSNLRVILKYFPINHNWVFYELIKMSYEGFNCKIMKVAKKINIKPEVYAINLYYRIVNELFGECILKKLNIMDFERSSSLDMLKWYNTIMPFSPEDIKTILSLIGMNYYYKDSLFTHIKDDDLNNFLLQCNKFTGEMELH
jgi:hypothetical protein